MVVLQHLATELEGGRHQAASRSRAWQVDGLQERTLIGGARPQASGVRTGRMRWMRNERLFYLYKCFAWRGRRGTEGGGEGGGVRRAVGGSGAQQDHSKAFGAHLNRRYRECSEAEGQYNHRLRHRVCNYSRESPVSRLATGRVAVGLSKRSMSVEGQLTSA